MKKIILIYILIVASFFVSQAQTQPVKEKIVVLNFKAIKVDKDIAEVLTENFITSIVDLNVFEVIERTQLNKIFEELKLTSTDEFSESTAIQIGKLAKSKIVIIGSIGKVGDQFSINARGIEVETGKITFAKNVIASSEKTLFDEIKILASLISNKQFEKIEKKKTVIVKEEKKPIIFSNDQSYKMALTFVITGSSLLAVGIPTFVICMIYAIPSNFSTSQWIKFYNDSLGTSYNEKTSTDAYNTYNASLNTVLAFAIIGGVITLAGFALDIASIPLFVKSYKTKEKLSLNINFGISGYNPAIALNLKF
jgi:TolB-like protein